MRTKSIYWSLAFQMICLWILGYWILDNGVLGMDPQNERTFVSKSTLINFGLIPVANELFHLMRKHNYGVRGHRKHICKMCFKKFNISEALLLHLADEHLNGPKSDLPEKEGIDPEVVNSTSDVTQNDLIDIPTNVLIRMSKLFYISTNFSRDKIITNLVEAAQLNTTLRLMIHACKVQQQKFIDQISKHLDSILHDKDKIAEYLELYDLAIIEDEISNQTKKRLTDKIVEVDFIKKWWEETVEAIEVDFMKFCGEAANIGKYLDTLLQYLKNMHILVRYGNLPRLYLSRFYQPRYNLGRFYLRRYYPS